MFSYGTAFQYIKCLSFFQVKSRFAASMSAVSVDSPTAPTARNIRTFTQATNRTTVATPAATKPTLTRRLYASTSSRTVVISRRSSHTRRRRHRRRDRRSALMSPCSAPTRAAARPPTTTRDAPRTPRTTPPTPPPARTSRRASSGVASTCWRSHRKRKWSAPCWFATGVRWRCLLRRRRRQIGGCRRLPVTSAPATCPPSTVWCRRNTMTIGSGRLQWTFDVIVTRPRCSSWSRRRRRPEDWVNGTSTVIITEARILATCHPIVSRCVQWPVSSRS